MADDGETEAEAGVLASGGGILLAETFEDVGEEIGIDAGAGVADADLDVGVDALEVDLDTAALGGKFDGVGEEIPDDLLETIGVAEHRASKGIHHALETNILGGGGGLYRFDGGLHDLREIDLAHIEAELAGENTGHVEQVLDEANLDAGVAVDDLEAFGDIGGRGTGGTQDAGPSEDGVDRGAEFVGEGGDEIVLQARRILGIAARGTFAGQKLLTLFLGVLLFGDVPRDFGSADHHSLVVANRRAGEGDVNDLAIFPNTGGFVTADGFAAAEAFENLHFLGVEFGRDQEQDRLADDFLSGVAEDLLRRGSSR